jgi:peptidoglycan/LPS O-acetylase OafA/YrhL
MLNSLQACRGVAAILVVLQHANHGIFRLEKYFDHEPFGRLVAGAPGAIDFFYVLCGFIMLHVHARDLDQPKQIGDYLWKRFSRIYLFYWLVLAIVIPIYFAVPQFGFGYERDLDVIVRSILLLPHPEFHMVLGVAWTLVYEVLFYLLFGLLILHKRLGIAVMAAWGCCVLAHSQFEHHPWSFLFSHHHLRFLAGMLVWLILNRWQAPGPRLIAGLGGVVFILTFSLEGPGGPAPNWLALVGFTGGSAVMVLGLVEAERSGLLQTPRWLAYLGDAAYSIYLVHFLVLSAFAKLVKALALDQHLPEMPLFFLHVALAIAAGCLCHRFIEHPLHQWSRRLFSVAKPAALDSSITSAEQAVRRAA